MRQDVILLMTDIGVALVVTAHHILYGLTLHRESKMPLIPTKPPKQKVNLLEVRNIPVGLSHKRPKFALSKQQEIAKQVDAIIVEYGGVPAQNSSYEYQLQTSVGLLLMRVTTGHELLSVFCRFEDVARAKEFTGRSMNPYSGKWNRYWSKDDDFETELSILRHDLEALTQCP